MTPPPGSDPDPTAGPGSEADGRKRVLDAALRELLDPLCALANLKLGKLRKAARDKYGRMAHQNTVYRHLGDEQADWLKVIVDYGLDPDEYSDAAGRLELFDTAVQRFTNRAPDGPTLAEAVNVTAEDIGQATKNDPVFWTSLALMPMSRANDSNGQHIARRLRELYVQLDELSTRLVEQIDDSHDDVLDFGRGLLSVEEFALASTAVMEATAKRENLGTDVIRDDTRGRIMLALFLAMVTFADDDGPHPYWRYAQSIDERRRPGPTETGG